MVIAAGTFRGGRMVRDEPQPGPRSSSPPPDPAHADQGLRDEARAREEQSSGVGAASR